MLFTASPAAWITSVTPVRVCDEGWGKRGCVIGCVERVCVIGYGKRGCVIGCVERVCVIGGVERGSLIGCGK